VSRRRHPFVSLWPSFDKKRRIWLVHGLLGNCYTTWKHAESTFWPDLLGSRFPSARVVSYGYDASVAKFSRLWEGVDKSGLEDYGKDLANAVHTRGKRGVPLYFIGHSLGGLVVKAALLECIAAGTASLGPVAEQTSGILFMATPHEGAALSRWAQALRRVLVALLPFWAANTNREILAALEKRSRVASQMRKDFQEEGRSGGLRHVKIFCFYETVATSNVLVVPKESATISRKHSLPIRANHRDIVRFAGEDDEGYVKVTAQLKTWIDADVGGAARTGLADRPSADDQKAEPLLPPPGGGSQKRKRKKKTGGGGVTVHGAQITNFRGGKADLSVMGVDGDYHDYRHNRGRVIGVVHNHGVNAQSYWDSDNDQWSSSEGDSSESGWDSADDTLTSEKGASPPP
jgi:hypothetical protein